MSRLTIVTQALSLAVLIISPDALSGQLKTQPGLDNYGLDEASRVEYADSVLHYLNEVSSRRRLTALFPNEQSPFDGLQLNFVNTRAGNLTFLTRDLVRLDRLPIVIGRVFDSRIEDSLDFGPGWKLSVVETLSQHGRALEYVDANGSKYALERAGIRIRSPYPHLTGIDGGSFEEGGAVLYFDSMSKTFRRFGDTFRLVEVSDKHGNWLQLEYSRDGVARVASSSGRYVDIGRDAIGRIIQVQDDAGRLVIYHYDEARRLRGFTDVAGHTTTYEYANERLSRAIDARGATILTARYDDARRVSELTSQHESMTFEYADASTTITNAMQQAATVWHHRSGLTDAVSDYAGSVGNIEFDESLRVIQYTFDGVVIASADYSDDKLIRITRRDAAGRTYVSAL